MKQNFMFKQTVKVFSAFFTNLAAGWVIALLVETDPLRFTFRSMLCIMFLYLAVTFQAYATYR